MSEMSTYANGAAESFVRGLRQTLRRGLWKPIAAGAAGFLLSAASLANRAMPVALGLLCAAPPGVYAGAVALGGCLGYWLFWKEAQGIAWMAAGLLAVALAGDRPGLDRQKLLLPSAAALITSGCGLVFLLLRQDDSAIEVFLLRVLMSAGSAAVFRSWRSEPTGAAGWLAAGLGTLALAQVAPARYLGLGYLAAGFLGARSPFPVAAMAGLGLDLAQITNIPMTGVMGVCFCLRLIPKAPKWLGALGPGLCFLALSAALGRWDLLPLPGLVLGGLLGRYAPLALPGSQIPGRKGPVGLAQARLERAAATLQTLEQELRLTTEPAPDRRAILRQAADAGCDTCPERRNCKARQLVPALPPELLDQPGLQAADLPAGCRKTNRLLTELRRGQELLRRIKADRRQAQAYRGALLEQYGFLAEYLQGLSDDLVAADPLRPSRFRPEIGICSHSLEETSGDRCVYFEGTGSRGYLLLCDGMGTGAGAAEESRRAIGLIRGFLEAGISAVHALRTFNSLCALRDAGGAATIDLLELDLRSGRASLYKWGAGPSYLVRDGVLRRIGTAGPPPGLSQQAREWADRLSLGEGETLIMLSDGAGTEGLWTAPQIPPGDLAAWLLKQGVRQRDDATVAVVRLRPSTQ